MDTLSTNEGQFLIEYKKLKEKTLEQIDGVKTRENCFDAAVSEAVARIGQEFIEEKKKLFIKFQIENGFNGIYY